MHIRCTGPSENASPEIHIPSIISTTFGKSIFWISCLKKYNNNYKYLLQVIDVFSKYLLSIPLRTKTGKEVATALESILQDPKYTKPIRRRPVWVRTDKGKEFLNTQFQTLLKREGIEFQVCKNPEVKCAVVERVNRTLRDKLSRYFTYKNTYRYIDVLSKFVRGTMLQFILPLVWRPVTCATPTS